MPIMDSTEENGIEVKDCKLEKNEDVKMEDVNSKDIKDEKEDINSKDIKVEDKINDEVKTEDINSKDIKVEDKINSVVQDTIVKTENEGPPNDLEKKIIRQIEYYFGDHNLARDRFMQETIKQATDGWVSLELLLTFNRLKTLSKDADVIINALKKSSNGLLDIDGDSKKIRRNSNKPLPEKKESSRDEECNRSVYVKGFPVDTTLDQLLEFFGTHGKTDSVTMRKMANKNKTFKGSVFVTFTTQEIADQFFKQEGDKYKDTDLLKEMKAAYVKRKEEQFDIRKKEREQRKLSKKEKQEKTEGTPMEDDDGDEKEKFNPDDIEKGCLLKLTGLSDKVSWEDIKELFRHHAEIAYVEYSRGQTEAIVRFQEKGSAALALERALAATGEEKKIKICEGEVESTILDGEDEISFWRALFQQKHNRTRHNHKRSHGGFGRGGGRSRGRGGRGRGGRGRGGRGFDRRGGREGDRKRAGDNINRPAAKQSRTEES